jgi:hypothetical protein
MLSARHVRELRRWADLSAEHFEARMPTTSDVAVFLALRQHQLRLARPH